MGIFSVFGNDRPNGITLPLVERPYFCLNSSREGPHVFEPKLPEDLYYGCSQCKPGRPFSEIREKVQSAPRGKSSARNDGGNRLLEDLLLRQVQCPDHRPRLLLPKCPYCDEEILEDSNWPPVVLYGGTRAGKTVASAVMAREINERFHKSTGRTRTPLIPRDSYWREAIEPLFQSHLGKLPAPTTLGEFHRLAWRFDGKGDWSNRVLAFVDVAGEGFRQMSELAAQATAEVKEAIFLADPECISTLRSQVPRDLADLLGILLKRVQKEPEVAMVLTPENAEGRAQAALEGRVQALVRRWEQILGRYSYPAKVLGGGPLFGRLARELVDTTGISTKNDKEVFKDFRAHLEECSGPPDSALKQVDDLAMRLLKLRRSKPDVDVAFCVTKLDQLGDLRVKYDKVVAQHLDLDRCRTRKAWRVALDKISSTTEGLLGSYDEELIPHLQSRFGSIGYFCVSSLGRGAEYVVERSVDYDVPVAGAGQAANPIMRNIPADDVAMATPGERWIWKLSKRVVRAEPTHSREPTPRHVLLPLMWLLTR